MSFITRLMGPEDLILSEIRERHLYVKCKKKQKTRKSFVVTLDLWLGVWGIAERWSKVTNFQL